MSVSVMKQEVETLLTLVCNGKAQRSERGYIMYILKNEEILYCKSLQDSQILFFPSMLIFQMVFLSPTSNNWFKVFSPVETCLRWQQGHHSLTFTL